MSLFRSAVGVALLCIGGPSGWALAANPPSDASNAQHGSSPSTATHAQPVYIDGFGQPVSAGTLGHYSGGTLVQNNQTLTGTVTGDSANQVTTGNNAITGDSLSNASGLPSVIQNTGNNVLIQNAVIVNVQMKP